MMKKEMQAFAKQEGQTLFLRRVTAGAYSPSTSAATVTSVDIPIDGFILKYSDRQRGDGSLIKSGDRKAVLIVNEKLRQAPTIADLLIDGDKTCGKIYQIIDVSESREKGEVFAYRLQIRG